MSNVFLSSQLLSSISVLSIGHQLGPDHALIIGHLPCTGYVRSA